MKLIYSVLRRIGHFFLGLQVKLALSYLVITIVSLLIFETLAICLVAQVAIAKYPQRVLKHFKQEASMLESVLKEVKSLPQEDQDDYMRSINLVLQHSTAKNACAQVRIDLANIPPDEPFAYSDVDEKECNSIDVSLYTRFGFVVLLDSRGQVLASSDPRQFTVRRLILPRLSSTERAVWQHVLHEKQDNVQAQISDSVLVGAIKIRDESTQQTFFLLTKQGLPDTWTVLPGILHLMGQTLLWATGVVACVGGLFGFALAHWFVGRFLPVRLAVEKWSQGDFTAQVQDRSRDELGSLVRHLNSMAVQLKMLLQARRQLAALEERHRLARDLHDSLKQQLFALGMLIGGARTVLHRDPAQVEQRFDEMEHLLEQAQEELKTLIHQLRPHALADKRLVAAVEQFCRQWEIQHGIEVRLELEQDLVLPRFLEEAYYRVMQEAFSNIARHSQATQVYVRLGRWQQSVLLSIADNGRGFEREALTKQGLGLVSMEERAREVGGLFRLECAPDQGTVVQVMVPLDLLKADAEHLKSAPIVS